MTAPAVDLEIHAAEIDSCQWLFLQAICEPSDGELTLVITEAATGEPPDQATLDAEPVSEIRELIARSKAIEHGTGCRVFTVHWPNYIAYSVRNESYTVWDDYEEKVGRLFVRFTKSRYLDFIAAGTFADAHFPGPYKHCGIVCLNHIIDVVSTSEPSVKMSVHGR